MFDNLKAMAGLASVLKDMPRIKQRIAEVKERLSHATVEAEAGGPGGAVRVVCSGLMSVKAVHLDPRMLSGSPTSTDAQLIAERLITEATNAALAKARALAEQELSKAAQELGLPIPADMLSGYLS